MNDIPAPPTSRRTGRVRLPRGGACAAPASATVFLPGLANAAITSNQTGNYCSFWTDGPGANSTRTRPTVSCAAS